MNKEAAERRGSSTHPLAAVTAGLPEWAKWMLHGIIIGRPLDADEVRHHIVEDDPAPPLPEVPDPDVMSPGVLVELELGEGCYGLAPGTRIEFGRRFTLIYGENGTGKSSLSRLLRAIAGRPSAERPPANTFTGASAEATLLIERDGSRQRHQWRADSPLAAPHIEVFDSADTRVDGSEYQLRPRSLVALEELRTAIDDLRFSVEPLDVPAVLRSALEDGDLLALEDPYDAENALQEWLAKAGSPRRSSDEIEVALAELRDEALADRRGEVEVHGRLARADSDVLDVVAGVRVPSLVSRLRATKGLALNIAGTETPPGIDRDSWLTFLRQALPMLEVSAESCPLCTSGIAERHGQLVASYRDLLEDQRGQLLREVEQAVTSIRASVLTHQGATESTRSPVYEFAVRLADLLDQRDVDRLDEAMAMFDNLNATTRSRLERARIDWRMSESLLKDAEAQRLGLRQELTAARRAESLVSNPAAVSELIDQLRRRARLSAATRLQGVKQRINGALRRHTEEVLETAYGTALAGRLAQFRVPHVDRLTARHVAKGGQASRRHVVGRVPAGALFSEGEQRALALADFAAELDTRGSAKHPVVFDDPVSSLDYRRIEHVHDYIRELLDEGRQVVVLTHSLWLAASLIKEVKKTDRAWSLVRSDGRLGTTTPLKKNVLGTADDLERRIVALIADAEQTTDVVNQHQLVAHGLGLLRAWCESYVEQKILCGAVTRLDWQVRPNNLRDLDQQKLTAGREVAALYNKLHQRIDAHAQPGELLHRPDGLADLKELWAEAIRASNGSRNNQ